MCDFFSSPSSLASCHMRARPFEDLKLASVWASVWMTHSLMWPAKDFSRPRTDKHPESNNTNEEKNTQHFLRCVHKVIERHKPLRTFRMMTIVRVHVRVGLTQFGNISRLMALKNPDSCCVLISPWSDNPSNRNLPTGTCCSSILPPPLNSNIKSFQPAHSLKILIIKKKKKSIITKAAATALNCAGNSPKDQRQNI